MRGSVGPGEVQDQGEGWQDDANHRLWNAGPDPFWASFDGWPGTFRPSGFKQTQIPFVMTIPVGPSRSPDAPSSQKSHGRMTAAFDRL